MMKKQYRIGMLMFVLILVLMLCGCTAAVFDASPEGSELGLPAASNPPVGGGPTDTEPVDTTLASTAPVDAAQMGVETSGANYGAGDDPARPEETQYGRALSGEELQALWDRLEGKWILSDPEEWKYSNGFGYPVYDFSASAYGTCRLREYSALGSGIYEWIFTAAREQDGVYTFRAVSESSAPEHYNCYENSGTLFTLQFTGDGISLALSRPTQFQWQETRSTEDMNAPTAVRPATGEECALLAQYGDEYGTLQVIDGGFTIVAGYEHPAREYRIVTDEELERLVQGHG